MEWLMHIVSDLPPTLAVVLLAMAPVVELRAALPVALAVYDFSLPYSILIVVIANLIPGILILYVWDWFVRQVEKSWPWLYKHLDAWHQKVQGKWDTKIEKYGPWALAIFVAIPLPGSGVWSGALAAWIFQLEKKKAVFSLFVGALLSAAIVAGITLGAFHFDKITL